MSSYDPEWPGEDEWGPWFTINPKDAYESRKHLTMALNERRCRHCKDMLKDFPPEKCQNEDCLAMNALGGMDNHSIRILEEVTKEHGRVERG